jgi:hypothetical protein
VSFLLALSSDEGRDGAEVGIASLILLSICQYYQISTCR